MPRTQTIPAGLLAATSLSAAVFLCLAGWVSSGDAGRFDFAVRDAIHARSSPPLTAAMWAVTQLASTLFVLPAGALIVYRLLSAGLRLSALWLVAAVLGGELLDQILKLAFHRVRPEAFFGFPQPLTFSFPSGHAITSCCFYGVLAAIVTPRLRTGAARVCVWAAAVSIVLAVGFSRVYLGVHYPTDVFAGYAAGVCWVTAICAGYHLRAQRIGVPMEGRLPPQ